MSTMTLPLILHSTSLLPDTIDIHDDVDIVTLPLHWVEVDDDEEEGSSSSAGRRRRLNVNTINTMGGRPVGTLSTLNHQLSVALLPRDGSSNSSSIFDGWRLHHAPTTHVVRAPLILADPLDASGVTKKVQNEVDGSWFEITEEDHFYNSQEMMGAIVLIERGGGIPFRDKVRRAQLAGAVGVVIMDHENGGCTKEWRQGCVPGGSKLNGQGFGYQDHKMAWESIDTPTLLITKEDGEIIKKWIGAPMM